MRKRTFYWILILLFLLGYVNLNAQQHLTKSTHKKDKVKKAVPVPSSFFRAKKLFFKAWEMEKEQNFKDALANYEAVLVFFKKDPKYKQYVIDTLNNKGGILAYLGKYDDAIRIFEEAIKLAGSMKNYKLQAELYYKLGIIFDHLAKLKKFQEQHKNVIYPGGKKTPFGRGISLANRTYTSLVQIGEEFFASRIQLEGSRNSFIKKRKLYTKLINLKVKGDFDPEALLVPDSVEFLMQIRKKGYYTITRPKTLLPQMEYSELNETMVAIPRKVKPEITEDFYRQGLITPDEITLTPIIGNRLKGKPITITDKETFKPGKYKLFIQKAGYNPIIEQLTIYPGEGPFILRRELKSKLRTIVYELRGDFTSPDPEIGDRIIPDEITLSTQPVHKNSKVKPGEYKLVIKKEGYEPIIETIVIEPDERPYNITKFMKTLPREVLFQLTGDYQKDVILNPDEVTFNGRLIKYGGSVRPDSYRVVIRKKGYDVIQERMIVEPKSEPFIVKKMLHSTPRRIQTNIFASFPKGLRLFPDVCTLNGKDTQDESFKPGEYELYIQRSGYKPIKKKINIAPDDLPYLIKEILHPKDVQIDLDLTQDVPPEDPNVKPKVVLSNEKTREIIPIKDGDKVPPEIYLLKIEMPGYEPEISREPIMPSEVPYNISRRLTASLRPVVTKIIAEYPPNEPIVPDEITLDNKPVGKDFKIKPGLHDLVILKEGYLPIRKQIRILASAKEFVLVEKLETTSRLVSVEFRDSYDRRILVPDEVMLGRSKIAQNTPQNLKPGEYQLRVRLRGYNSLDETVLIPVGAGPYKIQRFLQAQTREVLTDITGDYKPDEKLIPDVFTLGEIAISEKATVKPGIYNMVLQKEGYYPILKRLNIVPNPKPFIIKERMISKPRQVNVNIKSSFGNTKIVPDILRIGTESIKDGQQIKPGNYAMVIKKKGYKTFTDQIVIEPSEKPYLLECTLQALPILVKYVITNDFDNKVILPDVITLNDKIIDQRTSFPPGKYTVRIEKVGFQPKTFDILLKPSDVPYVIKARLESIPREIELRVTMDFPQGEPVDPEVAALNTKDVRDNIFKPGKYQLDIQHPGFYPIKEELVIKPGERSFVIERVLKGKPRIVKEKITYDVPPPEDLQPYKITFAPVENPKAEKIIKEGDQVTPGAYIMKITKEAYETIEKKQYVWAEELPLTIEETLIAKQVVLHINITYDVEPPKDLPPYKVSLIDKVTGIARFVSHGKRIKPGIYDMDIQRPGYDFGAKKEIQIDPSEQPYPINEKLLAKKRRISFDMVDKETGTLVSAYKIIEKRTGREVTFKDLFQPGEEVELIVKFKKYQTVEKRFRIDPGQGPYVAYVPLKRLKRYDFMSRNDHIVIDGIRYDYTFAADSKPIESHLITKEKGVGRRYIYEVWVTPEAKKLQVFGGYLFTQKSFRFIGMITRLNSVSVPKYIEHLERIHKERERGYRACLEVIEKDLKSFSFRRKLKQSHIKEIEQLMQYVEGWKLQDARDRVRKGVVLELLEKLK